MTDKIDLFAVYKKPNPFFFQAGMMLLVSSLFCWLLNTTESYSRLGMGLLVIYLIQSAIEKYVIT